MTHPNRFLGHFVQAASEKLGPEALPMVLRRAGLDADLADPEPAFRLDAESARSAYATVQAGMRLYYGRGARGSLTRIGRMLWPVLLDDAPLFLRFRAGVLRSLPRPMRVKPAMGLLANLLRGVSSHVTVHSLDLDWMLVDHDSPAAQGQAQTEPVCFVTLGLVQECLLWASGREYDVQETFCLATGGDGCKFHVRAV